MSKQKITPDEFLEMCVKYGMVHQRTCIMGRVDNNWYDDGFPPEWTCSACGSTAQEFECPNYCMNCGARVIKEEQ